MRGTRHTGKNAGGLKWCSSVMCLSWTLVVIWILFLIYCWEFGLLDQTKITTLVTNVEKRIGETEVKFRDKINHMRGPVIASPPHDESDSDIHVVFSTDCSPYQDWQTLVLFHSAKAVGQKGRITRIASGCDDAKKEYLEELYKTLYGAHTYSVHFTPDFKKDEKTGKGYDFYNKPWGVKHWLDYADPPIPEDMVVCILDPDMIFVRPITTQIKGNDNNLFSKSVREDELFDTIGKGRPVGQTYGLGAPWTNDNHKKFNRGKICGEGSPCLLPNERYGSQHYSVGPPYILHKGDMHRLAETWTKFVPRVYEGYPYLLAEMYAYSMAAAHEQLPHLQLWNYMVSNVDAGDEGWALVDQLTDVCVPPVGGIYYPGQPVPNVIHFCQTYRAGDVGWAKRRVPHNIFSCDQPMLMDPPSNLALSDYRINKGEKQMQSQRNAKRNAYTLCIVYDAVNAALAHYKSIMCSGNSSTNYQKTLNIKH